MVDPYERLANAIILQAVRDWKEAMRRLKRRPKYKDALIIKDQTERFFLSDWFSVLTKVDGAKMLERMREELL